MTIEERNKILETMSKGSYGEALLGFLDEEKKKIDTVIGIKSIDEALAREKAIVIIDRLFNKIVSLRDKKEKDKLNYK